LIPSSNNRRLAAILAADVVGYSRMMSEDESGTLENLRSQRQGLIEPKITARHGRIVKLMGDGILAEFPSAVEALQCAVEIQQSLEEGNRDVAEDQSIVYRIGINVGDIISEDDDIYGEGVNIAARLEALADPGGICISKSVHTAVGNKIEIEYRDMGDQQVKNISDPVHAYKIVLGSNKDHKAADPINSTQSHSDKPSIAVLPFANMSNDPDQEYFADGIAEDIITALSHIKQWFVVARNSSFVYKGRNVDIRQAAKELGVRYVLEGSVRKAGNKLRITGQLIEAETGTHLWANKFDGDLEDVFALQDKITESVVGAIEPSLRKAEIDRSKRKRPENVGAYDLYLRAMPKIFSMRPEQNEEALDLLHKAIELEPDYALAIAYLAWAYEERLTRAWGAYGENDKETSVSLARRAIAADRDDALVLVVSGFVLIMIARDYNQGLQAVNRAQELNPNIAFVSFLVGASLTICGDSAEGINHIENAIRVSPGDPGAFFFYTTAALAHLLDGRPSEALEFATRSARVYAEWDTTYRVLGAALVQLDRIEEACSAVEKLLDLAPNTTASGLRERWPIRNKDRLNKIVENLETAGLPD
jgi:adenylate cyclase